MEEIPRQTYAIVTAYSGVAKTAAYTITTGDELYDFGLVAGKDAVGQELMAVYLALITVPRGCDVAIRTRLEYIRDGCTAVMLNPSKPWHATAQARGPFGNFWKELRREASARRLLDVTQAGWTENAYCKNLAATTGAMFTPEHLGILISKIKDRVFTRAQ